MRFLALTLFLISAGCAAQTVFRDCPDCAEMVMIPAGRFVMGSTPAEGIFVEGPDVHLGYLGAPQHEVTVKPFAIGKYDVTRGEFAAFVAATGYDAARCKPDDVLAPEAVLTDRHPAICVGWRDAQVYIKWMSAKTGKPYRLASEAEWEYAARGGTATPWFWGEDRFQACDFANSADLSMRDAMKDHSGTELCRDGQPFASPVGAFRPNGWGLYDMAGDVWQWTADCWHPSYDGAPADGSAWMEGSCDKHPIRGGAWNANVYHIRPGNRNWGPVDDRSDRTGFRLAMTLP